MFALAYLNSHFQTGLKSVMDRAVLAHPERHRHANLADYAKVDEIPFDFQRRIMSVVVRTAEGKDRIISKGAPEAIFPRCKNFELDGELLPMEHILIDDLRLEYERLSRDGFRVLAIASKDVEPAGGEDAAYAQARTRAISSSTAISRFSTRRRRRPPRPFARCSSTGWP